MKMIGPSILAGLLPVFLSLSLVADLMGQSGFLPAKTGDNAPATTAATAATSSIKLKKFDLVEVFSTTVGAGTQPDDAIAQSTNAEQVRSTAGAYSDIPRFLQTLPGVMFDTDSRNTYMVNGGNPLENLFVINGVEIPNINHISTANSSGGFVSMIDTDAVSSIKLHKMLYGAEYSGALSSVLEIKTLEPDRMGLHGDVSVGFAGADLVLERSFGQRASMMIEARKSIVNYFTNDIGFDGVPKYASVLSTTVSAPTANDTVSTLYLEGNDSLDIRPNLFDPVDPGLVDTYYAGDRVTIAGTWDHRFDAKRHQMLQVNVSRVRTTTLQTDPRNQGATVYTDNLLDQPATLKYDYGADGPRLGLRAGLSTAVHGLHYRIAQPNGYPSPYSTDPAPMDATNINFNGYPVDTGAYSEVALHGPRGMQVNGGARFQHWGLNGDNALSPRISLQSPSTKGVYAFAGVGRYSQLAPLPTMLGIASNQSLRPISDTQMQVGVVKAGSSNDRLSLSVYRKLYRDYPVSTEFPSLSQADIVDIFAQPIFPMPMTSRGTGVASGVEAEVATGMQRRAFAQVNLALQSVRHRALDAVSRRASFDMPVLGNVMSGIRLWRIQTVTVRYSYHTGTPYTPFLFALSQAQKRPIYDLSQIDTRRGSSYGRLDLRYEIEKRLHEHSVLLYVGLENALDRKNYYQYVFLPNCLDSSPFCGPHQLNQVGRLGEGGLTYRF